MYSTGGDRQGYLVAKKIVLQAGDLKSEYTELCAEWSTLLVGVGLQESSRGDGSALLKGIDVSLQAGNVSLSGLQLQL